MTSDSQLRKQVKEVLEHLYDPAYLAAHPLAARLAPLDENGHNSRAQRLRAALKQSIEALRPPSDLARSAPEWRSYLALRCRYVQGMSLGQVEHELGISQRQLQRELHKGLDAVTAVLAEDYPPAEAAQAPGAPLQAVEADALRKELGQWQFTRAAYHVQGLLGDALATLEPLLGGPVPNLQVNLPPDLPPVWVDATLMRQALVYLLRPILVASQTVALSASAEAQHMVLLLAGLAVIVNPQAPDWQMCELLLSQQGGTLATRHLPATGMTEVEVRLPRAAAPRILIIDDNQAIHQLIERYLAAHMYEVLHAYSGSMAQQQAEQDQPDVILLDVMMPQVDGWQVLRTLKSEDSTAAIPVIVCSVLKEPELAVSLGAHAYLKKPVERLELLAALAGLRRWSARAGASHPGGA
jgi:CheY-like chemotaxis protein